MYDVVRLPGPIEGEATPNFSSMQKLPVPPQAAGVAGTLNSCVFLYIIMVF